MAKSDTFRALHRENRHTIALAFPIVAGLVGQMLMGLADTLMVGKVGTVPLAACGFANTLLSVPLVFGFGVLAGVSVNASHAFGAGKPHLAGESLRGGLVIALTMGLLVALATHALLRFLPLLDQPPEVNSSATTYLLLCAWSMPAVFATGTAKNFCEALARPWPPFWIMLGGVFLNVLLNWILIYGNLGAPAMGLDGAGLATLLSRIATMVAMLLYPAMESRLQAAWPTDWTAPGLWREIRRLLGIGIHSGGLNLCEVTGFSFGSLMMGWLGVNALAAHQIAITCAATTFMVPLGIGQAVSVRVGQARGAGRHDEIRAIVHGTLGMTLGIAILFAVVYLTFGSWIAGWFTNDPSVQILASQLLVLAGVFQIFDGIQIASSGALRGFGDTKVPFLFGILAYWIVALPVSHLAAFRFGLGASGIWIGFVVGLAVAAAALSTRLLAKCSAHPVPPR
ncbi:MAG: MATE family efflux transporter [Terrimicrobiaceae bacterium]